MRSFGDLQVYDNMLNSAPGAHLNMDLDEEMEECGSEMKLSEALASTSLLKRPSERVINKDLIQVCDGMEPPWADVGDANEWRQTADGASKGNHEMLTKFIRNKGSKY